MDETIFFVFTTIDRQEEAERIGRNVVAQGLAACVNIIPKIRSIYSWKGRIREDTEFLMLIKTAGPVLDRLESAVRAMHTYELPEFVALSLDRCEAGFRNWILQMTSAPGAGWKDETGPL